MMRSAASVRAARRLMGGSTPTATKASGGRGRKALCTRMSPCAEVPFGRSLAYALEDVKSLVKTRTAPAWYVRAAWGNPHVGTGTARYVGAIG